MAKPLRQAHQRTMASLRKTQLEDIEGRSPQEMQRAVQQDRRSLTAVPACWGGASPGQANSEGKACIQTFAGDRGKAQLSDQDAADANMLHGSFTCCWSTCDA